MNDERNPNSSIKCFDSHDNKEIFARDRDKERYEFIENIKLYSSQIILGIEKGDNCDVYTSLKRLIAKLKEEKTFDAVIEPEIFNETSLLESIQTILSSDGIENENVILALKLISILIARNTFSNETLSVLNELNFVDIISSKLSTNNTEMTVEIINIFTELIDSSMERQNYIFSIIQLNQLHDLINTINNEEINFSFSLFLYKLYQNVDFTSLSFSISELFNISNELLIKTNNKQTKFYALWSIITLVKRVKGNILDDVSHNFDFSIIYSFFNSFSESKRNEIHDLVTASIVFIIELLKLNYDISFFDFASLCNLIFSKPDQLEKDYLNLCYILSKYMEHFPSNIDKFLDIIREFENIYNNNAFIIQKSANYCVLGLISFVDCNDYNTYAFPDYFNAMEWVSRGFQTGDILIYRVAMKCLIKVFEIANASSSMDNCIELFNSHSLADTIDEIYDDEEDNIALKELIDDFKSKYFS